MTTDHLVAFAALEPLLRRVRKDKTAVRISGKPAAWTSEPLTSTNWEAHCGPGPARGCSPIKPGESTTMVGLLDFDSHKGEVPFSVMRETAQRVMRVAAALCGAEFQMFRSTGGNGIHLIALWDTPQDARSVRALLVDVLDACELRNGTRGVMQDEVEVFPKQDNVPMGGFGNMFVLPLAGKSEWIDPAGGDDLGYLVWKFNDPVPVVPQAEVTHSATTEAVSVERVRGALRHIGNDDFDYDTFMRVLMGIHDGLGAGGIDVALEWAALSTTKFDERETRRLWKDLKPGRTNKVTVNSIFKMARDAGWVPDYADVFDILPDLETPPRAVFENGEPPAKKKSHSDQGNADILIELFEGNVRHLVEKDSWMVWNGKRHTIDTSGVLLHPYCRRVIDRLEAKASDLTREAKTLDEGSDRRKELIAQAKKVHAWSVSSANRTKYDGMANVAAREGNVSIHIADLDKSPTLLGFANGVVDLKTGLLRPVARDDLVTKMCPFDYNPNAKAPRWLQFITEITGEGKIEWTPRPHLAQYLLDAIGYWVTGSTAEQKMFLLIGAGSNGKNVLLDTLQKGMGDYCVTMPAEALMAAKFDADAERASPVAASLAGARLAVSSESKATAKLDVALVKHHTGGGFMTARMLRENTFRFEITHKLVLMTNHRPQLDHLDAALTGRLHLVPFDRRWNRPGAIDRDPTLPDGDKDLMNALLAELPGILALAVQAAVRVLRDGLQPPAEVISYTDDYFKENDTFRTWLDAGERYDFSPAQHGSGSLELFTAYTNWCTDSGLKSSHTSVKSFSMAMVNAGVAKKLVTAGARFGFAPPKAVVF